MSTHVYPAPPYPRRSDHRLQMPSPINITLSEGLALCYLLYRAPQDCPNDFQATLCTHHVSSLWRSKRREVCGFAGAAYFYRC